MSKSRQTLVKTLAVILCLISTELGYGQKETKTFNETFSVSKEAVLNIDTSHTDIEFETWGKNEVSIEAIIELEGASEEETHRYFEKESFEILGNSTKVDIKTKGGNAWASSHSDWDVDDFHVEFPELPNMEGFESTFEMMELPEITEKAITTASHFNYQAYQKDGEKYLKKWQKEFEKGFDKDYQKQMEEWGKKMAKKQEEITARQEKQRRERFDERRFKLIEERNRLLKEKGEERSEKIEEREKEFEKRMAEYQNRRNDLVNKNINRNRSIIITRGGSDEPTVYYFNSEGENKNYKVKKTIKIRMPKGMKIKMNVRHGEVKLADNIWHMDANLSHSSLWAASIDGFKTKIKAAYSPINVDRWYVGDLQADYAESVNLKEVFDIKLNTTSSNVNIDKLIKKAFVNTNFGQLKIATITKDFTDLDVTLENTELEFNAPNVAFDIYVNGTSSSFTSPSKIVLEKTKNHNNTVHKGYHINEKGERSIVINAKYSEVKIN